ncbi:MAG TPA: alpha-amylase family glycosyl hydrolase [Chryseosolibacter sp.]|nr:alpha-amylase family glycosyl hydrolase [Chryseosolibacter sp.]
MNKLFWMLLVAVACSSDGDDPTPAATNESKQYGIPYAAVPDALDVVMYEVNVRALSAQGNFQGVIDKLDHIKALGFNTIWLMPIHPVGEERSAGGLGSPYSVKDYLKVNPEFGDLRKLRDLVQAAHERGMAVIIDWVANHTAWDNSWMANKSWYVTDANGNVIIPPGTNWQDVAELNYNNADMRKAMIHAMKYWVLEANIDGFRCDAVDFVPSDFWKQAIDTLKKIPDRKLILLAEGGKAENFTAGFQMNYAWDFYNNLKSVYKGGGAASIFTTHENEYKAIPAGAVKLRYTTNHDESAWEATPVEIFGSRSAALSASVITIFTSAAPLIYSSQEVGRHQKLAFFTNDPIDWAENPDMVAEYSRLLKLYNASDAFRKGTLKSYADADVAVFTKTLGSAAYLVAVNVRSTERSWDTDPALVNSTWTNTKDNTTLSLGSVLTLPPFEYVILKKS